MPPASAVKRASQLRMIEYLKGVELTNDFEANFIEGIDKFPYLSDKQDEILTRIYEGN